MHSTDLAPISVAPTSADKKAFSEHGSLVRPLIVKLCWIAFAAAFGVGLGTFLSARPIGNPDPRNWYNVFYVLFARDEPAGLALVLAFSVATILWLKRGAPAWSLQRLKQPKLVIILVALATFTVCAIGTQIVFHSYNLTADENMADFQAQLFLHGKLTQEIPPFWEPMVRLIIPTHAAYFPKTHSWSASYLPMYGAIRALLMAVNAQWMTNAAFAAISILALAAVTRKLWPNEWDKTILAAGLLVASPQFLVMGMTSYAMPAHLALNLVWLWLYCDPTKRRFWLTPLLGVIALGLHQPFFHALFAAPFLFRLILNRQWKTAVWFGAIYLAGAAGWFLWWHQFLPGFMGGGKDNAFGLHAMTPVAQAVYLSLLLGWLALPIPLLAWLGATREKPSILQDAALSCVLTFGFYIFVQLDQAHGWGDRYFHGVIGCLILVTIVGWDSLCGRIGKPAAATFVAAGLIGSLLVQFPLRCLQAESFVRPFALAANMFHGADADLIVFDPRTAWYSADLRRNDPFLKQRPVILSSFTITDKEADVLGKAFPRTRFVSAEELEALGMGTERQR